MVLLGGGAVSLRSEAYGDLEQVDKVLFRGVERPLAPVFAPAPLTLREGAGG